MASDEALKKLKYYFRGTAFILFSILLMIRFNLNLGGLFLTLFLYCFGVIDFRFGLTGGWE